MLSAIEKPPSWRSLLTGANGLRSLVLCGGVALHAINIYIVTTILPTVIQEIGGLTFYAWNTTLFVAASIVGSAISAKVIERQGAAKAYLFALLLFSAGAILCGLAPSMSILLLGRTVQGLGGGILFALSYALIRVAFKPELWSRAMALVSGMWGIATLCGPAIGGMFAQSGEWRMAFWALLPIVALLALIVWWQFRDMPATPGQRDKLPWLMILLLVLSVLFISAAGLSDNRVWNGAGIVLGLLLGYIITRLDNGQKTARLLPTGAWQLTHGIGLLFATMALLVFGLTTEIYVPYFLQVIHHMSPLMAGYLTAIMAAGWTLAALSSASASEQRSLQMIRIGPVVVLVSLIVLAVTLPMTTAGKGILFCYGLALLGVGFGIGLAWPHLLTRVFSSAPEGEETLTSSSVTTVQLYATALAAALAGVVTNAAGIADVSDLQGAQSAARMLFGLFAIAPALAAMLAWRLAHQTKR